MLQIQLQPVGEAVTLPRGSLLLPALLGKKLNVAMSCGGNGICSTCHVRVRSGMDQLSPIGKKERQTLSLVADSDGSSRLACQTHVLGDGVILDLPQGMYIESASELLELLGERAPDNILHPIRGHVLIPKGKIITRTLLEQSRSLEDEVRQIKSGLIGEPVTQVVRPVQSSFTATGSGVAPRLTDRPMDRPTAVSQPAFTGGSGSVSTPSVRLIVGQATHSPARSANVSENTPNSSRNSNRFATLPAPTLAIPIPVPSSLTSTPQQLGTAGVSPSAPPPSRHSTVTPTTASVPIDVIRSKPPSDSSVAFDVLNTNTPSESIAHRSTKVIPAADLPRSVPILSPRSPDTTSAHIPETGDRIGKCLLMDCIGSGGLGVVFRALHTTLNVPVAVKFLRAAGSDRSLDKFRAEARILARLNHPNVVRVLDFEDDPSLPYVVMEFVEGLSLQELLLQAGRLWVDRAIGLILGAIDGLEAAWQFGIIHRDVKPANILVTRDGNVKLVDFGLAVRTRTDAGGVASSVGVGPMVDGTVAYLCPDRARDPIRADHRADIYALGVTFFQALTGQLPFTGATAYELLAAHACDPIPDNGAISQEIRPELFAILTKMLAKKPDDRFSTYAELRQALLELPSALPPATR